MDQNLKVKIRISGKCMYLSIKEQETVDSIVRLLQSNGTISRFVNQNDLHIKNNWSRVLLTPKMKIGEVAINQKSGLREIEITNKSGSAEDIQSTFYDPESETIFKQACEYLLSNDQQGLNLLCKQKRISNSLLQLLVRVKSRMKNNEDTTKQIQKLKQQTDKLNKLFAQNKQCEIKLANALQQVQTLQSYIQKIQVSENMVKIQSESKLSEQSIKAINQMYEKIEKKLQANKQEYESKMASTCENLEMSMRNSRANELSCLYKSKTFQTEAFKINIQEYGEKLKKFIEDYKKEQIEQFKSCFFIDGLNPTTFIKEAKGKTNVVLLIASGQKLFGIFTDDPSGFGVKSKSADGFFFWLSQGKAYTLKPKQPVWKSSAIDIKIGNDSLIMGEPTKRGVQLKIKHKTSLKDSFEIDEEEAKKLIGAVGSEINITSFQMLSVSFLNEKKERIQTPMSESVYLKEESV